MEKASHELIKTRGKLGDLQTNFSDCTENVNIDAWVEGLDGSMQMIGETFPDIDLSELQKVVIVVKGEMTFEDAFGKVREEI